MASSVSHSVCWEEEIFQRGGNHLSAVSKISEPAFRTVNSHHENATVGVDMIDRKSVFKAINTTGPEPQSHIYDDDLEPGTFGDGRPVDQAIQIVDAQSDEDMLERRSKSTRLNAAALRAGSRRKDAPAHLMGLAGQHDLASK